MAPGLPIPHPRSSFSPNHPPRHQFISHVPPSKIVCVGRNYVEHARELGNEMPKQPLLFLKPPSAVIASGEPIILPPESQRVEHEAELAVIIGRRCSRVSQQEALDYVGAYAPLNDVTARDLQRADGQFTRGKGFDTFCPIGAPVPASEVGDPTRLEVIGRVNGEVRQRGSVSRMAFPIPMLIEYISTVMTLEPGDVIATGTPAGVGPIVQGDVVEVEIPGVGILSNPVEVR